jgi:TIR domain
MRIFICWSGVRSGTLARALGDWLPQVIEGLEPPFISFRIEPGKQWQEEIGNALRRSGAGLVCVTPESLDSHWIHFEAGALASAVNQKPLFLYSYRVERLTDPLQAYQSRATTCDGTWDIVKTIARAMKGDAVGAALESRFNQEWPKLARVISGLGDVTVDTAIPRFADLFNSQTFDEPMPQCRDFSWIGRHQRLAGIDAVLNRERPRVETLGEEHLLWLYDRLHSSVKSYMTDLIPVLLAARNGRPATVNELNELEPELIKSCETARIRIQALRQRLLSTGGAPVLPEAVTFERAGPVQRKQIAYEFELRIRSGDSPLSFEIRQRALNSLWEFDRVVAYQTLGETIEKPAEVLELSDHVQRERNRAILEVDGSLMALHCAFHALDDSLKRLADPDLVDVAPAVRPLVEDLGGYISATVRREYSDQIIERVGRMRDRLLAIPGP